MSTLSRLSASLRAHPARWAALLALLSTVTTLDDGLMLDDRVQALFFQGLRPAHAHAWDMFLICGGRDPNDVPGRIARGELPWWTLPELSVAFFRPISVATHYLDYWAWPNTPSLMHLQNAAWYALLAGLVAVLYTRVLGAAWPAALSSIAYAVHTAHVGSVAWIASRNTIVSAALAVATLVAHDVWRRDRRPGAGALAPALLVLALCAGEGAVAALAYLAAYALLIDTRTPRSRVLSLVPYLAVTATWAFVYRAWGYGAHGSGVYRDPGDDPLYYLFERLPQVFPFVLRDALVPPGALAWQFTAASTSPWFHWLGAAALVAVAGATLALGRAHKPSAFFLMGAVGSACVVAGANGGPVARLLFMSTVGLVPIAAQAALALLRRARAQRVRARRFAFGAMAVSLLALQVPAAFAGSVLGTPMIVRFEEILSTVAKRFPEAALTRGHTVYVLGTPSYFVTTMAGVYEPLLSRGVGIRVLATSTKRTRLTRTSQDSFVLEPQGGFLEDFSAQFLRAPERGFVAGTRIPSGDITVTIERVRADGQAARVRFDVPELEARRDRKFVAWKQTRFVEVELPAVGQHVELVHSSTPAR